MSARPLSIPIIGASSLDCDVQFLAQEVFHTIVDFGLSFILTEVDVIIGSGHVAGKCFGLHVLWFSLEQMHQEGSETQCFFWDQSTIHNKKGGVFHFSTTWSTESATLARIRFSLIETGTLLGKELTNSVEESTLAAISFCRILPKVSFSKSAPLALLIVAILYSLVVSDRLSYVLTVKIT